MGLTNVGSTFQRVMDDTFRETEYVFVYFDDILIFSNEEQHFQDLDLVFQKLQERGLKISLEKCILSQEGLRFLGHLVTPGRIESATGEDSRDCRYSLTQRLLFYVGFLVWSVFTEGDSSFF